MALTYNVSLARAHAGEPWGFRLQGGTDFRADLCVKKVTPDSPASRGLQAGDQILAIGGRPTNQLTHAQAEALIRSSGASLSLSVKRSGASDPLAGARPTGPIKFSANRAQQAMQQIQKPAYRAQ